jgi:hypothetical protein
MLAFRASAAGDGAGHLRHVKPIAYCQGPYCVLTPTLFGADVGAVDACSGPVQLAGRVQLGEQDVVRLVEDSGLLPVIEAPPAGMPEPDTSSRGGSCQAKSSCGTWRMAACGRSRSGAGRGPGAISGQSGSISAHSSSSTIHGPGSHTVSNGRIITLVMADQD